MKSKIKLDDFSAFIMYSLLLSTLLLNNGFYIFFPLLTLFVLLYQLQQPFKPSIFSIFCLQHYLQIASAVWLCNYLDMTLTTTPFSGLRLRWPLVLALLLYFYLYFTFKIKYQNKRGTALGQVLASFHPRNYYMLM